MGRLPGREGFESRAQPTLSVRPCEGNHCVFLKGLRPLRIFWSWSLLWSPESWSRGGEAWLLLLAEETGLGRVDPAAPA